MDKEVVAPDGTIHLVPYKKWKSIIVQNPLGETAKRAMRNNDKDLDTVFVKTIPLKMGEAVEQVDPGTEVITGGIQRKDGNTLLRNISKETARRLGFRTESEGKGGKRHKINKA